MIKIYIVFVLHARHTLIIVFYHDDHYHHCHCFHTVIETHCKHSVKSAYYCAWATTIITTIIILIKSTWTFYKKQRNWNSVSCFCLPCIFTWQRIHTVTRICIMTHSHKCTCVLINKLTPTVNCKCLALKCD